MIILDADTSVVDIESLEYWNTGEKVLGVEPAGNGNMNVVLRVYTNQRSVILKQSKPYVQKFPQIPAPIDRIKTEFSFFEAVSKDEVLAGFSPKVLAFYPNNHLLITEDLGTSSDFSALYQSAMSLSQHQLSQLFDYLNQLHRLQLGDFPDNLEMRKLNHEHIYIFPFSEENGFDLNQVMPGLQKISLHYKRYEKLKEKIKLLGQRYLHTKGQTLLHGDFYPGSWLNTDQGIKIIDPEFGFMGDPEFDLGVLLAHADICGLSEPVEKALKNYYKNPVQKDLLNQYRGVEILRRLIGIAQLPLTLGRNDREILLEKGQKLIMEA